MRLKLLGAKLPGFKESQRVEQDYLSALPVDTLLEIFSHILSWNLLAIAQTSSRLRKVLHENAASICVSIMRTQPHYSTYSSVAFMNTVSDPSRSIVSLKFRALRIRSMIYLKSVTMGYNPWKLCILRPTPMLLLYLDNIGIKIDDTIWIDFVIHILGEVVLQVMMVLRCISTNFDPNRVAAVPGPYSRRPMWFLGLCWNWNLSMLSRGKRIGRYGSVEDV
ncbi:uncharacterized protein RAG0_13068 [Rhynchosporium agropyri]|uniref:F-box domain-containing protein n=1 Tax=Rhynchosporium agropyri TaxID=914238 RepID=A0A1E1LDA5_9HELO|nr:uncharacterized protein RAG0_13068 [Rhynchosporium agropyri]